VLAPGFSSRGSSIVPSFHLIQNLSRQQKKTKTASTIKQKQKLPFGALLIKADITFMNKNQTLDEMCTFHDGCKQGIDQQIFNRISISRKITHPQSCKLHVKLTGENLKG